MFVRITFISMRGMGAAVNLFADTYVKEMPHTDFETAYSFLMSYGFTRQNRVVNGEQVSGYDPEEQITPGSILRVVECDKRGYSRWDRVQFEQMQKLGSRKCGW